jgi:hypothetical protein
MAPEPRSLASAERKPPLCGRRLRGPGGRGNGHGWRTREARRPLIHQLPSKINAIGALVGTSRLAPDDMRECCYRREIMGSGSANSGGPGIDDEPLATWGAC